MDRFQKLRSRTASVGIILGVTTVALLATATPSFAVSVAVTLSATQGPSGGGNTVTAVASTAVFQAGTAVEFQYVGTGTAAVCSATYAAPAAVAVTGTPAVQTAGILAVPPSGVLILTANKLAITVPSTVALATGQTTARYNVCVYSGTTTGVSGSPLIANGSVAYTIGAKSTITGLSPSSGPAQGGTLITVTGSNFPTAVTTPPSITATLGGLPLTNIVVQAGGNSFTALTPAHAAGGPVLLTVTTAGGTVSTLGTSTTRAYLFTYSNGIQVIPNTAPNTRLTGTNVDVQGVNFSVLNFVATTGANPDDPNAHVYLVHGVYNPAVNGGVKSNGEIGECVNVLVISDTELVCTLSTATSMLNGTPNIVAARTVTDGATTNGNATVTSATAAFTSADVGLLISGTGIPAGSTILSVTNGTTAVISANATATGSGVSVTIGPRLYADGVTTSGSTTLTSATAGFTTADVGRAVTGAGIPVGTVITGRTDAQTVTLSQPATATGTGVSITIANATPQPIGTYTITVVSDGGVDVQPNGTSADANYTATVVSSGSTFTVADY